jgi:hypothetical protein
MSSEASEAPLRSPSPAAERMRQYRKRHREGTRRFSVQLRVTQIETLIRTGYLEPKDRDDSAALQWAIDTFISDAFFQIE